MTHSPVEIFDRLNTSTPPRDTPVRFRTVHVLGASVAGLLSARVLADHAERVVVVEPDASVAGANTASRPGVPQGYQVHALLSGGRLQLERFYPGFVEQAVGEGAVLSPYTLGFHDEFEELPTPGVEALGSSRPFLESLIRRRTFALPNVEMVTGRVTGLDYAHDAVSGVRYRTDAGESAENSDFVVDATGRGSRVSEWLERGGWPRPEMERLQVDVRYFTARFRRSDGWAGPYTAVSRFSPHFPSNGLAVAGVTAIEDQQWTVLLAYFGGHDGPTSTAEFVARCRELQPIYREAVAGEPVGEVVPYRYPDSRWRHVERLDRFPARLAVVGDAVASFNPVYAQGMTSAGLQASGLSEYLRSDPDLDAPARYFLDLQHVVVQAAWQLSTGADAVRLGIAPEPTTETERRSAWARQQIMAATRRDVQVATAFHAVAHMTAHPATLGEPELVQRAVSANENAVQDAPR